MSENPVSHILKSDFKTLGDLFAKLEALKQLNKAFAAHLEPHIAKHCQIVKYENGRLIVFTDSGSWTTQLQFLIPELMDKLRSISLFHNMQAICCKTRPEYKPAVLQAQKDRVICYPSPETIQQLAEIASTIPDETVRARMEKWVMHLEKSLL